jgi:hypothetical protein
MGARQKLNSAHCLGSLLSASLVGWLLESWLVAGIALLVLIGVHLYNGDIRPGKRRQR